MSLFSMSFLAFARSAQETPGHTIPGTLAGVSEIRARASVGEAGRRHMSL